MIVSIRICFVASIIFLGFGGLNAQSCPGYVPCQNRTVTYTAVVIKEGKVNIEDERIQYTNSGPNAVQFDRTLNVKVLGGGSHSSNTKGVIQVNANHTNFPPAFFLPTPVTVLSFFDPPQVELSGDPCFVPHNMSEGPLSPCNEMRIRVSRSKVTNSPTPGKIGKLDASQSLDLRVSYPSRTVLATNQMLTISGTTFECVIIKERYTYGGNFSGAHWELNWYANGIGLVQSKYFENDPGVNFNAPGNLGSKTIKSW